MRAVGLPVICRPSPGHQPLQFLLLLLSQRHTVFLHHQIHPHFPIFFLSLPSSHMLPAIVSMMVVY